MTGSNRRKRLQPGAGGGGLYQKVRRRLRASPAGIESLGVESSPPVPLSHRPPFPRERGNAIRIDLPIEGSGEIPRKGFSLWQDRPSYVPPLPVGGRAMGEGDRG
jgi:hypothetical protein